VIVWYHLKCLSVTVQRSHYQRSKTKDNKAFKSLDNLHTGASSRELGFWASFKRCKLRMQNHC